MRKRGISDSHAITIFEEIDGINLQKMGVAPERYLSSMRLACQHLLKLPNLDFEPHLAFEIETCGDMIRTVFPLPIVGAKQLLSWAHSRFDLALLTRGTEGLQLAKLDEVDFRHFFSTIRVRPTKTVEDFSSLIADLNYEPQQCWVIGDSIKSDINPGLAIGANCIHYEHKHPFYHWQQEHTDKVSGSHFHALSLAEVQEHLASAVEAGASELLPRAAR